MFSYVDLVRVEIALDVEERFGVTIAVEETNAWRPLADIARMVAERSGGSATEAAVVNWVCTLLADAYGVADEFAPEGDVFRDYDQVTGWFFARKRGGHSSPPDTEPRAAADGGE